MANVALSVLDPGHSTTSNLQTALQASGHSVSVFADSALTDTSLLTYDVIMCPRSNMSAVIAARYRNHVANGVRFYWGLLGGSSGTFSYGLAVMRLCAEETAYDGTDDFVFSDSQSPIFAGLTGLKALRVSGFNFRGVFTGTPTDAKTIVTNASGGLTGFVIEPGGKDLDGVVLGSACGGVGFLYSLTAFDADGIEALNRLASFSFQNYSISGVVRDDAGSPTARTVRAYRRDTGALLASTTSNSVTGAYSFLFNDASEVQLVCLDDGATRNDLIIRTTPS